MRKIYSRIAATLMAAVMVLCALPTTILMSFAVNAEETVLDAAIFCSDVHGSTSDLTSVMSGVATSGVDYSSIGFVGDTCLTVANTESAVNSGLGYTPKVMFSYAASHDTENSADISTNWNYSGEVADVSDYYLVYTIRETDMQNNTTAEADFTTWYSGLTDAQKALPIFIMSHRPLHARRNDNSNAADWYDAISAAAATSDIVFFWAHNHTGEDSVDTAAYYVAKNGTETIKVYNGDTVVPNFTYMNAGYINANGQNPARINVATTVKITADSLIFQDYTTSGTYTNSSYSHNVTVARQFAATKTAKSIEVSGTTHYTIGGNGLDLTVTVTYDDGTTEDVTTDSTLNGYDLTKSGKYTVTATYGELTDTIDIVVAAYGENTTGALTQSVEVVSTGVTAVSLENVWGEPDLSASFSDYASYEITLTGYTEGNEIEYTMSIIEDMDTTNLGLYHVSEDGMLTPIEFTVEGECIVFTSTLTGTFAYGAITVPDGYELYSIAVSNYTKDWFVGDSLDLTDPFTVTATYKKTDSDDFIRVISVYEENNNPDGYTVKETSFDMTVADDYDVEISYTYDGVTCTTTFPITVWGETFTASDVTVTVGSFGVESMTMADVSDSENVKAAAGTLLNSYKAYDINLDTAEGYELSGTHTVKMPAPENANVVYYFNDTTGELTEMEDADFSTEGYVTFTTDHFSIYMVGENAEEAEKDLTLGDTTTTKKTVYVLTSSISSGNSYLIVNGNSAGGYYALANNSGSVAATGVTVVEDDTIGTYIELTDATDELWTVGSGYTFQNGSYYLGYTTSGNSWNQSYNFGLSTTSRDWSYSTSNHRLSTSVGNWNSTTYYLRYNDGWTWTSSNSSSGRSVYFYVPTEIETTVDTTVKYEVTASDIEHIYDIDSATAETEALIYELLANGTATSFDGGVWTVKVVSDANGIIDTENSTNETLYFTGNEGTATLRVYYELDGDDEDTAVGGETDYKVWTTFTVTATNPYYTVDITHNSDGTGAEGTTSDYVSVTNTIVIKGEDAIAAGYDLWAKVYLNGTGDPVTVDSASLTWISSNTSVATVDDDGNVTFPGGEGTAQITVYYEYTNAKGESVKATDVVTFSVSKNQYTIPSDGTDDFPEYPNQGSIRFDKTAVAQGNFSQTGIAKVELSMTGVPYTVGNGLDVIMMLDFSTSMKTTVDADSTTRYKVTLAAAAEFVEQITMNEDGTLNDNRVGIYIFNGTNVYALLAPDSGYVASLSDLYPDSKDPLADAKTAITGFDYSSYDESGTRYDKALAQAWTMMTAVDKASDNTPAFVFMSDGGPTGYTTLNSGTSGDYNYTINNTTYYGSDVTSTSTIVGWFTTDDNDTTEETDDTATPNDSFKNEYYTHLMKQSGYPVYTVGLGLSANSSGPKEYTELTSGAHESITSYILTQMATDANHFYNVPDGDAVANMGDIFSAIAASILEAATNVVVEDKIDSHYTMNFSLPSGVTGTEAGMSEFYIQVVEYTLDNTTHERSGDPAVLENFTFNADGTLKSHAVNGTVTCDSDSCTHITFTDGVVTEIKGTYFTYSKTDENEEILTWKAEKLTSTELALQYFVYLENSAGVGADQQVDPGVYYTNEYATITYTNFNGKECQQEFPVPQMTWKGAQVTYVFYLVNEAGQPVNRAGRVVPFAESIYVTNPVTYSVTWNEETGTENILAQNIFASAGVPDVYELYDTAASYVIRVYQTENVDDNGVNGNYFQIGGASDKLIDSEMDTNTTVDNSTTKVYNTKSGTKYDEYGIYSIYDAGTILTDGTNNITTTVKAADIDYSDTTVAFAVVWKPELVKDTVVIDFGLDVVIDVATNDALASGVVGVRADAPSDVTINNGTYNATKATSVELYIDANKIGTATVENLTSVRFSLDKTNGMQFTDPVVFYYESDVNYYTYTAGEATLNTNSMYSSVTVIPATTIYYEDEYVTLKTFTKGTDGNYTETNGWATNSVAATATQDQDRPGESKISADLDADNLYGYDSAYAEMSTFSMGSAAKVTVKSGTYATAEFTFYGTGFDIISMTDTTTGYILVSVYDESGEKVAYSSVDTYYGMEEDGTLSVNNPDALYQVPVIKISGLTYGEKYTAKITVSYVSAMDHTSAEGYDFYLDAIRIYDPTGNENDVANEAYVADGEGWPVYEELRNNIIAASNYSVTNNEDGTVTVSGTNLSGAIFIDCNDATTSIADYVSYGPNNELYLAAGQAIAFNVNVGETVADVQLGIKVGNGDTVTYEINGDSYTVNTATDLYYSILEYAKAGTVTIKNVSGGILSITNIKVTYTEAPVAATSLLAEMTEESAGYALMSLRSAPVADDTVTEDTESEETTAPETETDTETETETEAPETETETEDTESEETETSDPVAEVINKVVNVIKNAFSKFFGWFR